ncbi:MAG: alpha-amylase [Roseburia sp.]|nr:alpha-amylase [Roseburia sp.]
MRKRIIASLLTIAMLISALSAGCGGTVQKEQDASGSEPATSAEEQEPAITALTYMEQYNTAPQQVTDDNYRTYYEVFVYSFYDSDGDGIGDFKGLTEKLDYINDGDPTTTTDLGCNGIWLMPIMPSPSYHKYDVIDYYEIDPEYGTMEDFKAFVKACDERGIRVMIDLVMNHSSSEHEWFQTACEYLKSLPAGAEPNLEECPYVDYYFFDKQQKSGYAPLEGTEWYYEGQFWSGMPDLNMGNEAVRAEFEAVVDYWLDLGVTGFRLDAAKEFYSGEDEKNIEVLTWFNDMVKAKNEDVYIVAEVFDNIATYAPYHASGVSCFNFAFADYGGTIALALREGNGKMYASRLISAQEDFAKWNENYIDSPFYTNHDISRSAGYYQTDEGFQQLKLSHAMNLLMSGSAFLYYGEELGMRGSGRDENKRVGMYWSMDENAEGMCDGPKDREAFDMKFESFEEQNVDGDSIYNFVKQTILLRNQFPAISHGVVEKEEGLMEESGISALKKSYNGEEVLLVFNLAKESRVIDLSKVTLMEGELEVSGVLLTSAEDIVMEGTSITLPSYSVIVLTKVQ